jgi:transcription initiation factor IIE alpha subunit
MIDERLNQKTKNIINDYRNKLAALSEKRMFVIGKFIKKLENEKIEEIRKDLSKK